MSFRVGFGFDVHQLKEGLDFWIGGIIVHHTKGGHGHSDADVLVHVICDALLGAANLGDIGVHFPDTSSDFKNIDTTDKKEIGRAINNLKNKIKEIDSSFAF